MAFSSSTEYIHGYCNTDVQINGSDYNDVKLKVLKNLSSDILLGQDFQSQHRQVIFKFKGKKKRFCCVANLYAFFGVRQNSVSFHNLRIANRSP